MPAPDLDFALSPDPTPAPRPLASAPASTRATPFVLATTPAFPFGTIALSMFLPHRFPFYCTRLVPDFTLATPAPTLAPTSATSPIYASIFIAAPIPDPGLAYAPSPASALPIFLPMNLLMNIPYYYGSTLAPCFLCLPLLPAMPLILALTRNLLLPLHLFFLLQHLPYECSYPRQFSFSCPCFAPDSALALARAPNREIILASALISATIFIATLRLLLHLFLSHFFISAPAPLAPEHAFGPADVSALQSVLVVRAIYATLPASAPNNTPALWRLSLPLSISLPLTLHMRMHLHLDLLISRNGHFS